jgi:hypothetical protein
MYEQSFAVQVKVGPFGWQTRKSGTDACGGCVIYLFRVWSAVGVVVDVWVDGEGVVEICINLDSSPIRSTLYFM